MAKLNQILAIEKGIKAAAYSELTELNKAAQRPDQFTGFTRTYQKNNDEDEDLPAERKRVLFTADELLQRAARAIGGLINVAARKEWSNTAAYADVVVDGAVLIPRAPVTFLLFLEKQLNDLTTFFKNIPVMDEGDVWSLDTNSGFYKAQGTKTHRTKKTMKPIVLYQATPEHPAQTQLVTEDVIAGWWSTVKESGGIPKTKKVEILARVEKLSQAVKQAREDANMREEISTGPVGNRVFSFLLDGGGPSSASV